jgi:quercetin dioxygenase-like cupin family protein
MFRRTIGGGVALLGTVLATGAAAATPPHGVAVIDNVARGPAMGSATMTIKPGTEAYAGAYTLPPGSSSGWRTQPGVSMLAVREGVILVTEGQGCITTEYKAPEVAVLTAGTIRVENAGSAPAGFVGYFDNVKKGTPQPLVKSGAVKAPTGCAARTHESASTGLSGKELAHGHFMPIPARAGNSHLAPTARLTVPQGSDVLMLTATVAPGTSTGWYRHAPGLAFLTTGEMQTYEATDTGCAKVEDNHAGEVVSHAHHDNHFTTFVGSKPAEVLLVFWGMGNNRAPMPGIANFAEAYDFTPMPPAGCTLL